MRMFESISPYYKWISEDGEYALAGSSIIETKYGNKDYYLHAPTGKIFKRFSSSTLSLFMCRNFFSILPNSNGSHDAIFNESSLEFLLDVERLPLYNARPQGVIVNYENQNVNFVNSLIDVDGNLVTVSDHFFSGNVISWTPKIVSFRNKSGVSFALEHHSRVWNRYYQDPDGVYTLVIDGEKQTEDKIVVGVQNWVIELPNKQIPVKKSIDELFFYPKYNYYYGTVSFFVENNISTLFSLDNVMVRIKFNGEISWKKETPIEILDEKNSVINTGVFSFAYATTDDSSNKGYNYVYDTPVIDTMGFLYV